MAQGAVDRPGRDAPTRSRGHGLDLGHDPNKAIFRINRDIRFSKDKSPYKTHVGAALTRDGEKMSPGVLYIHIDPEGCFAASGFYAPEPEALAALRRHIADYPDRITGIIATLKKAGYPLSEEDSLKRLPRGFEAVEDPEVQRLLRLKSLVVRTDLSRKLVGDGDALIARLAEFAVAASPLLSFGWDAIGS